MERTTNFMKNNLKNPTFLLFLDSINSTILSNIKTETYFSLNKEKKITFQYLTLKVILQTIKVRAKLTDKELYEFVEVLLDKNEESENFELAGILVDILKDFQTLNNMLKDYYKPKRTIKVDKKNTDELEQ
jgi:hypothetical protein